MRPACHYLAALVTGAALLLSGCPVPVPAAPNAPRPMPGVRRIFEGPERAGDEAAAQHAPGFHAALGFTDLVLIQDGPRFADQLRDVRRREPALGLWLEVATGGQPAFSDRAAWAQRQQDLAPLLAVAQEIHAAGLILNTEDESHTFSRAGGMVLLEDPAVVWAGKPEQAAARYAELAAFVRKSAPGLVLGGDVYSYPMMLRTRCFAAGLRAWLPGGGIVLQGDGYRSPRAYGVQLPATVRPVGIISLGPDRFTTRAADLQRQVREYAAQGDFAVMPANCGDVLGGLPAGAEAQLRALLHEGR
jgi:hypothetical protein